MKVIIDVVIHITPFCIDAPLYGADTSNITAKRGKLILPHPVTGSQPLTAANPLLQHVAFVLSVAKQQLL